MIVLDWMRRLFGRATRVERGSAIDRDALTEVVPVEGKPVWCVVANIVMERGYGPGGEEKRRGTKKFAPGAKVFVYYFFWRSGHEKVTVIGRHRKSHRYISVIMPSRHLANWRAELVYSPHIAKQICEFGEFAGQPANSEKCRIRAREIVAQFLNEGAIAQPFTTRPPAPL